MSTIYVVITYTHEVGKPVQVEIGRAFQFKSVAEIEIVDEGGSEEITDDTVIQREALPIELVE